MLTKNSILTKVPVEIWRNIFRNICYSNGNPLTKWLGECRLVCKAWEPIAKESMFESFSLIASDEGFKKIRDAVKSCGDNTGPYIKSLWIRDCRRDEFDESTFDAALDFAFTEKLTELRGCIKNENIYRVLIRKVQDPRFKLVKLNYVPMPAMFLSAYNDLVLNLKNTLKEVHLKFLDGSDNSGLIEHFNGFKELETTNVELHLKESHLTTLDSLLNTREKFVALSMQCKVDKNTDYSISKWFDSNREYKKLPSLSFLKARDYHSLEYAVKKFESIEKAQVALVHLDRKPDDPIIILQQHMDMFDMLKNIPDFQFTFMSYANCKDLGEKLLEYAGLDKSSLKVGEYHSTLTVRKHH